MEKKEIEKEHILTQKDLHDLMISFNSKLKKQINEEKLSETIYKFIDDITDKNKKVIENNNDIETEMYFQDYLQNMLIFKYNNGRYIYWIEDRNKSEEANYINKIEFLKCLLDNYNDLNGYNLIEILNQAKSDLNFVRKSNEYIDANKDPLLALKKEYGNYDYVKILKNYNLIGYYDIMRCKEYLETSDDSQNDFNLTIDEKMCLHLIILYGLKNIYFYYSKLYKYSLKEYNNYIKNMNVCLNFIEKNKNNVSEKKIYSKEENYYEYIMLKNIIMQFYLVQDKDYSIIRRYIRGNFLRESIQLIYFDYLINNKKFEEARNYIDENSIYLYSNIEKMISVDVDNDEIVWFLIHDVVDDYKMTTYDTTFCDATLNDLLCDDAYKNKYVIPVLRFIINYLYLLKSENKEKQVDCLYSFLKIFEKGFGIEDFFVKFNYELLFLKLEKINKVDKNADIDNIDCVIDEISNIIEEADLIDKQDREKVEKMYPYINFRNLNYKVRNYIATGDTIMLIFNDSNNIGFDYSSAVIEWSKAVELEAWEKLTNILSSIEKDYKKNICNQINPYKYIKRNGKKELTPGEVVNFKFGTNIGTFDAIEIRFMKDGRTMRKYLYDNYYSKYYDLDEKTYNDLIDNILLVHEPRNNAAHKDTSIQLKEAKDCQTVVVAAKKILEVLSNLKRKYNK